MRGLDPRIHLLAKRMDRRVKPGDDGCIYFAGTNCASCSVRLISWSFAIAAKVSDMCSVRPSHSSTCTIDCEPASECVVLVWVLCGVSRLRQPPRSTDLPGSPIGA